MQFFSFALFCSKRKFWKKKKNYTREGYFSSLFFMLFFDWSFRCVFLLKLIFIWIFQLWICNLLSPIELWEFQKLYAKTAKINHFPKILKIIGKLQQKIQHASRKSIQGTSNWKHPVFSTAKIFHMI